MQKTSPIANAAKEKIVDDILQDLPTDASVEINLPSENKVYSLEDPAAPITLRPMTFDDEKQIINAKKDQDPVNIILQRCSTNLNISDLLSIDKLYLIMKLREISYGDDYNTLLICSFCKEEMPTTVKLSELNINPVPDDFTDPIEITLPSINKTCKVSLPRVRDEKLLGDIGKTLDEIWRFIKEIVDSLLLEAYILVKRAHFTYSDVKGMTRTERTVFLKLLKDELEREDNAAKRSRTN